MRFMATRDQRMRQIVNQHQEDIAKGGGGPSSCTDTAHRLYYTAIVASTQAALEANPCIRVAEALGLVSSAPLTPPPCTSSCRHNVGGLRKHTEGLLKELVGMAGGLPWVD